MRAVWVIARRRSTGLVEVAIVPAMATPRSIRVGVAVAGLVVGCTSREPPTDPGTPPALDLEPPHGSPGPTPAATAPVVCKDPPCPLFDWMATRMQPALLTADLAALEAQFDYVAEKAPPGPGYPNWASIARDGASAARDGAADAARAACRSCHEQYGARYARELRSRPI
jgi:hypothetical protein